MNKSDLDRHITGNYGEDQQSIEDSSLDWDRLIDCAESVLAFLESDSLIDQQTDGQLRQDRELAESRLQAQCELIRKRYY